MRKLLSSWSVHGKLMWRTFDKPMRCGKMKARRVAHLAQSLIAISAHVIADIQA